MSFELKTNNCIIHNWSMEDKTATLTPNIGKVTPHSWMSEGKLQ